MNDATPINEDDIEIPVLEITHGWSVDDVKTEEDCTDAIIYLVHACTKIGITLEMLREEGEQDGRKFRNASSALAYKQAALEIVRDRYDRMQQKRMITAIERIGNALNKDG